MTAKTIGALLLAPAAFLAFAAPASAEEFEGPFVGAGFGYSRDELGSEFDEGLELGNDPSKDAAYIQAFAGYDLAVTNKVRLGIEGAIGVGLDDGIRTSFADNSIEINPEFTYEITGRAGYLVSDNALVYLRGGFQSSRVEATVEPDGEEAFSDKGYVEGWLAGGGVEYALGGNLRTRLEYRYSDLGDGDVNWDRHQVLAGVVWGF